MKWRGQCWVEGCGRRPSTKRLCKVHYNAARQGRLEVPAELGVELTPPCDYEGCPNRQQSKGLCHTHYVQARANRVLSDPRPWGRYVAGGHGCRVEGCDLPAQMKDLCPNHARALSYGLSTDQAVELFRTAKCSNPGCDNSEGLVIDHNHTTGLVRDLLCSGCNSALGFLKDDVVRILGLAEYAKKHES